LILPQKVEALDKLAAQEFNYYIKQYTGHSAKIVNSPKKSLNTTVYIGAYEKHSGIRNIFKALNVDFQKDKLGDYGYMLKTLIYNGEPVIVITGNTQKGTLNGLYAFFEEVIALHTGLKSVNINYTLERQVNSLSVPELNLVKRPYSEICGFEWEGMALDNTTLNEPKKREEAFTYWKNMIDFARRQKMNLLTNWPYHTEKSNMNNFPDIVLMDDYPKISLYTREEIIAGIEQRKKFLDYATANGMPPYLTIYVPGWVNKAIQESMPELVGETTHEWALKNGAKPFQWDNPKVHKFLADLARQVAKTYPDIQGLHFRVWGAESLPDDKNINQQGKLIKQIIGGMVKAAHDVNPNLKFILSEYNNYDDKDFSFLKSLPADVAIQRKWAKDWDVVPDAQIPSEYLKPTPGYKKMLSLSIPQEELLPFWFPTARLLQEGLLKYLQKGEPNLDGLPINPRSWNVGKTENDLNFIAASKLAWDPFGFDYKTFYHDFFTNLYGKQSSDVLMQYTELTSDIMEDFCYDYAGIIPSMADIYNSYKVYHFTTHKNSFKWIKPQLTESGKVESIVKRLHKLIPEQEKAVKLLDSVSPVITSNREYFNNTYGSAQSWLYLFKSRCTIAEILLANRDNSDNKKELVDRLASELGKFEFYMMGMTNLCYQERNLSFSETRENFRQCFADELKEAKTIINK